MKRDVHKYADIAVSEINRLSKFSDGTPGVFEPESARALRNIVNELRGLEIQGEAVKRDLGRLTGKKPPRNSAVRRLFAQEIPSPTKTTAAIAEILNSLSEEGARRAAQTIITIYTRGKIDRLRTCPRCRRWFFADRGNRRVCTDSCRSQRWQMTTGRDSHRLAHRRWWLKAVGLPEVRFKLKKLPQGRLLTKREEARKLRYQAKEARYQKELVRLERLKVKGGKSSAKAKKA